MNDFMNYMAFRDTVCEEIIQECLDAAARGETGIEIDCSDLDSDEIEYIEQEVRRRL